MAIKIEWQAPDNDNITQIRISRSTDKFGTYTVIDTIDATDDAAAKTAANNWVTSYIDTTGTTTNWYKIEFFDGTNVLWSEFSDPITVRQEIKLCTVDDIKAVIDTIGRWTDDEIFDAIKEVEDLLYAEMGTPINAIWSCTGSLNGTLQDTYYTGEENIYRVDRFFYGTTSRHELFLDDAYKTNLKYGMVRILPVASGGPTLTTDSVVEVRYVPRIINRVTTYRTAKFLLEGIDYASRGATSKELEVITNRLDMVEKIYMERIGLKLSSDFANYDPVYGVNKTMVRQDHDRNKYISSFGW